MKSIITFTLFTATVTGLGGITGAAVGVRKTDQQTNTGNDASGQYNPLELLPGFYLTAAKVLELDSGQISEIAQKYETYLITTRAEQENYGNKLRVLYSELQMAEQNNRRRDIRKYNLAIRRLVTDNELLQNRRYAELQRAIMGILPQKKRKKWAGILFASEVIRPFRWVMEAEQIQKINDICVRNEKIAKVKTLRQRTVMLMELRSRIKNEILTDKQRTKLWVASYEADKRKKNGQTGSGENSERQKNSNNKTPGERSNSTGNPGAVTKTWPSVQKRKKRSRDEKPHGAGGW